MQLSLFPQPAFKTRTLLLLNLCVYQNVSEYGGLPTAERPSSLSHPWVTLFM